MSDDFVLREPQDTFLKQLIEYYFFLDIPAASLQMREEYVMPFPRITFGYFFEHPFTVINHTKNESRVVNMVISRIQSDQISVTPNTDHIKILGAHAKPYTLSFMTDQEIGELPWLIDTATLFGDTAADFKVAIDQCTRPNEMFDMIESTFLSSIKPKKDLEVIVNMIHRIEAMLGDVKIKDLADEFQISERTVQNQFQKCVGCSPKSFIELVRLKTAVFAMHANEHTLTSISYQNKYFDQAHFIKSVRKIIGKTPKQVREDLPGFRFLQF